MRNTITLYAAIVALWTFFLGALAAIGGADTTAAILLVTAVLAAVAAIFGDARQPRTTDTL